MLGKTRKNATFIGGCPRSGTTLITALLDHHPELLLFPEEYLYLTPVSAVNPDDDFRLDGLFKDKVLCRLRGEGSFLDQLHGKQRQYVRFDFRRFEAGAAAAFTHLNGQVPADPLSPEGLALVAVISGFRDTVGEDPDTRWVFKHPNYERYGQPLFADFPEAKMLWMVRDPRQVILSRTIKREKKRHLKRGGKASDWHSEPARYRPAMRYVSDWERSIKQIRHLEATHPGQILKVRYEDLVAEPRAVMARVAAFLGIGWNDTLLSPSFLGTPWKGDSMQGRQFNGIAVSKGSQHRLASRYLWQIEAWLGDTMVADPGRYAPTEGLGKPNPKALAARMRGEWPLDYLRNRLRMWTNRRPHR